MRHELRTVRKLQLKLTRPNATRIRVFNTVINKLIACGMEFLFVVYKRAAFFATAAAAAASSAPTRFSSLQPLRHNGEQAK